MEVTDWTVQTAGWPMRLRGTSRTASAANDISTRPLATQMPAPPQLNVSDVSYATGVEVRTVGADGAGLVDQHHVRCMS